MNEKPAIPLVLDQGMPRDAAELLRQRGCECVHAGEVGMSTADDQDILRFAAERTAVVVTLDADFHAILAVSGANAPSVIRLRLQGLGAAPATEVVLRALSTFPQELQAGSLVTVKSNKMTCHRLPIGGER